MTATSRAKCKEVEVTVEISHVYPPVNGTPKLFGGVCGGVEKI